MFPSILILIIGGISLGIALAKHGQPTNTRYHAGVTLLSLFLQYVILYWGGFFNTLLGR